MRLLPFFFMVLACSLSMAQTVLDNNPPSVSWRQINTPHFRMIFPAGYEEQGQRMANTLEHIRDAEARTMGVPPRKVSIILQNRSAISNGFVTITPRRAEFFGMPPQDYNFIGNNDWFNLLAAHEYRHIVQYQHATRGFNKFFYYLFGATTLAGMAQAAAPDWFWEGDAVVTETAFTPGGRGRIPNFDLAFRTNLLEGRSFNYHKQYLRSYKHFIPDHYVLGYHMVSYLRRKTEDPDIWEKVTARSWSVPFIPFAFSNALKKESGEYVTQFYKSMAADLKNKWRAQLDSLITSPYESVNVSRRGYTDYLYPHQIADGRIIAMKRGIGDIETFVSLENSNEETVHIPGFINDTGMLSVAGDFIVWNEYGYHPRWLVKNHSLIKAFDIKRKRKYVIGSRRARYAGASLSHDNQKIVTVETGIDYKTSVQVLSFPEGRVLKKYPNNENAFYAMPRWTRDGDAFVILKVLGGKKAVVLKNFETGEEQTVIPFGTENIGYPIPFRNYIIYNSPVSGIDNLYACDVSTGTRYKITESKYGAYNASVSPGEDKLYYNEQTVDGQNVVSITLNPSAWKPFQPLEQSNTTDFKHLVEQESHSQILDSIPAKAYPVKKYSRLKGIINPYTWGFFLNSDLTEANIGISSRDILSTTAITAGYTFDINERTSRWLASVSYQGAFPIFDVSASMGNRSVNVATERFFDTLTNPISMVQRRIAFEWQERNLQGGVRIPLLTTSSKFLSGVNVGANAGFTQVSDFKNNINEGGRIVPVTDTTGYFYRSYLDNGELLYTTYSLSAYRLLKRSRRDINSRFGQTLRATYSDTPFRGSDFTGKLFAVTSVLYFPGLSKHHSLWGYWAYQFSDYFQRRDNYIFRNQIPLPRGVGVSRFERFHTLAANYTLPVWYPDIAIGPVVNIQRIRLNGFIDLGLGSGPAEGGWTRYTSTGIEARADINVMRFLPQLDVGLRVTRGLAPEETRVEFLLGTFNL